MTDQPPPPTEKKPRRPAAARKRGGRRVAAKKDVVPEQAAAGPEDATAVDAGETAATPARRRASETDASKPRVNERAAAPVPADVAARLDPAPLAGATSAGTASADEPAVAASPVSRRPAEPTRPGSGTTGIAVDDASTATARSTTPPALPSEASPLTEARLANGPTENRPAGDDSSAPPSAATPPIARQASLRPGELIRVPLSVRWRDLDAFNHVNNSKYLSYLEEARLRWMLSVPGMGMDDDVAPVVAASNLSYRRPIGWPGDVVVELFVERIGGSSLTIGHRIVDSKDGNVLYCDGNVVMVWIDRNTGRSAPLPEDVRAACR